MHIFIFILIHIIGPTKAEGSMDCDDLTLYCHSDGGTAPSNGRYIQIPRKWSWSSFDCNPCCGYSKQADWDNKCNKTYPDYCNNNCVADAHAGDDSLNYK